MRGKLIVIEGTDCSGKEYANTIGTAYGYIVSKLKLMDRLLDDLKNHPEDRRMVMSLWQDDYLKTVKGISMLVPGLSTGIKDAKSGVSIYTYDGTVGLNNQKIDENTRFDLASVTKLFTTIEALKLVEEGKFSLEKNVSDYKNGKYKMVCYSKNEYENRYEVYGQEGSNEEIYVHYDSKKIEYRENDDLLVHQKGQVLESIYYNISQWYIPQYKLLDLFGTYETKVYNGRECYVIRKNSTDSKSSNYNECWIDKETMMNVRNVMNTQNENTQQYSDSKIYLEEKEISDTDVELPSDLDGFDSIDS